MKKKLLCLTILLLTLVYAPLSAVEKNIEPGVGKIIYGYRIFDGDEPYKRGPAYFNINNPKEITLIYSDDEFLRCSCAGAYVDGYMYSYIYGFDESWMFQVPYGLCKIDLKTGDIDRISDYSEMTYLFADMTYDVITNEMYYIADSPDGSTLGKVGLTDGSITPVKEIPTRLMTLACNMYGQLFVITAEGKLAKLDKKTGDLTIIGNTGRMPMLSQSMDFDRDTNILYWSMCDGNKTELLTVNITTGEISSVGPLGKNISQITSLCIPYTPISHESPDLVTDINIISADAGALKANISFKAPVKSLSGASLASISKIEVFRNTISIKTFNNPIPGESITFEDIVSEKGLYAYKIVATNIEGVGVPAFMDAYIGEDIPGIPTNIILSEKDGKASLSWGAPLKGLNGGWVDVSTLKYKVTRLPDNVEYDNVTGNNLIKEVGRYNFYSYKVQSITKMGEGGYSMSNKLKMGTPFILPYKSPFDNNDEFDLWTDINNNADDRTWSYDENFKMAVYKSSEINNADDWLISPPMKLEAGLAYRIKFDVRESFADKTEKLKVYMGEGNTIQNMTKLIGNYEVKNIEFETKTITIVPDHTGTYYLGFYACSDPDMWWLCVNNIVVEQFFENDLASLKISGHTLPISGKKYDYKVSILNYGSLVQNNYRVELIDEVGNVLAEKSGTTPINPNQTKEVNLEYVPEVAGVMKIKGRVVLSNDEYTLNNETGFLRIDIQPVGDDWVEVGKETIMGVAMPINFNAKTSAVQTIYTKDKLKCGSGMIKGIAYPYSNTSGANCDAKLQIYLANTDLADLKEDWLQPDKLTLVYNGDISVVEGKSYLNIKFDTPFNYDSGKNLCVMTNKPMVEEYVYGIESPWTSASDASSRIYGNDFIEFLFAVEQTGSLLSYVPDVMFKMNFTAENISDINNAGNSLFINKDTGKLTVSGEYEFLEIYDTKGRVLMNVAGEKEINLTEVTSGIYVIKVRGCNHEIKVYKIVK